MKRTRATGGDSLELLLDTICNTFGGIVFISLLIVLMLQSSRDRLTARETSSVSEQDLELMRLDLAAAEVRVKRLQEARARQIAMLARHIPDELQERLHHLRQTTERQTQLEKRAAQRRQENLERFEELQHTHAEREEMRKQLEAARKELTELESQSRMMADARVVRLPRARSHPPLHGLQLSLCYDRLYFRHDPDELLSGQRRPNPDDYLITEVDSTFIRVQPKPTAGIDLRDPERARALLLARLRRFPQSEWSVTVTVWPDSFDVWSTARSIIADAGYHYALFPCKPETEIVDRGGREKVHF
ncbi:hypothetical protein Mal4_35520 [Maioricimonas rarisocia]|uniref:Uncharacterized protein n=1 Tax=Maioricimonas rarisocia TaxID=2528026 RepID=A0A517Z9Q9_9PLAN|nr:hypothetical protein [Maioricimonas rarisocia]QDU39215.1 hypothetical protein Mal4_35520 [Maioricimonas rarisocia]